MTSFEHVFYHDAARGARSCRQYRHDHYAKGGARWAKYHLPACLHRSHPSSPARPICSWASLWHGAVGQVAKPCLQDLARRFEGFPCWNRHSPKHWWSHQPMAGLDSPIWEQDSKQSRTVQWWVSGTGTWTACFWWWRRRGQVDESAAWRGWCQSETLPSAIGLVVAVGGHLVSAHVGLSSGCIRICICNWYA